MVIVIVYNYYSISFFWHLLFSLSSDTVAVSFVFCRWQALLVGSKGRPFLLSWLTLENRWVALKSTGNRLFFPMKLRCGVSCNISQQNHPIDREKLGESEKLDISFRNISSHLVTDASLEVLVASIAPSVGFSWGKVPIFLHWRNLSDFPGKNIPIPTLILLKSLFFCSCLLCPVRGGPLGAAMPVKVQPPFQPAPLGWEHQWEDR